MTPKQRVQRTYPGSYSEWVPGWGLWTVCNRSGSVISIGFSAAEAWRNAITVPRILLHD